jgi:hypothetical protein
VSRAAHHEAVATLGDTEPGQLDEIEHPEHPAMREAREATALPWWWAEAAAVIFTATIAVSALLPWGFAQ